MRKILAQTFKALLVIGIPLFIVGILIYPYGYFGSETLKHITTKFANRYNESEGKITYLYYEQNNGKGTTSFSLPPYTLQKGSPLPIKIIHKYLKIDTDLIDSLEEKEMCFEQKAYYLIGPERLRIREIADVVKFEVYLVNGTTALIYANQPKKCFDIGEVDLCNKTFYIHPDRSSLREVFIRDMKKYGTKQKDGSLMLRHNKEFIVTVRLKNPDALIILYLFVIFFWLLSFPLMLISVKNCISFIKGN